MIITGGFNVYSAEVEQALMQHPAVRDCAVVGLPDDKWGERVTAVIESSAEVQPDELVAFVKARIGSVKAPKQVELWQELPRSRLGKVLKADVRTAAAARQKHDDLIGTSARASATSSCCLTIPRRLGLAQPVEALVVAVQAPDVPGVP